MANLASVWGMPDMATGHTVDREIFAGKIFRLLNFCVV
jgi:hypothetical protein